MKASTKKSIEYVNHPPRSKMKSSVLKIKPSKEEAKSEARSKK
tara:strand:+ start:329 stop:457 length:129 start_codon:yes stop_codon:yes gene_type:complete